MFQSLWLQCLNNICGRVLPLLNVLAVEVQLFQPILDQYCPYPETKSLNCTFKMYKKCLQRSVILNEYVVIDLKIC